MEKEIKNSIAEAYVAGSFRSDLPEEYGAGVYYKSTNPAFGFSINRFVIPD